MKRIVLGGLIASLIITATASASYSFERPLPTDRQRARESALKIKHYVNNNVFIRLQNMDSFCEQKGLKDEFCPAAYHAKVLDLAIHQAGYSTKDTITKIGKNGYLGIVMYKQAELMEIINPIIGLFGIPGGGDYLVKSGLVRERDLSVFEKLYKKENIVETIRTIGQKSTKTQKEVSSACVQNITQKYKAEIGAQAEYIDTTIFEFLTCPQY